MNKVLIFRPQPIEGESLHGYLFRIGEANLISNTSWLKHAPEEMGWLRTMIGTTLQGRIPSWITNAYGWSTPPNGGIQCCLMTKYSRCCPECLTTMQYWPAEWELIFYTVCHRHGRMMVKSCPDCLQPIMWNRANLMRCNCGSDMTCWPRGTDVTLGERQLCARLALCLAQEAGRSAPIQATEHDQLLRNITTQELVTLIGIFGSHGVPADGVKSRGWLNKINTEKAPSLVHVAEEILASWPKGFYSFLGEIGGYGEPDAMRRDPTPQFISFTKCLRNYFTSPGLDFVMVAFRSFAAENWHRVLDRRNNWMSPNDYDEQRYLPAASVTKHLRISRRRVKELLEKKILRGYIKKTPQDREFAIIERTSLIDAEDLLDDYIPLNAVAVTLGLPRERVNELVTCGLLSETSRVQGSRQARLFSRKEVAVFVRRLSTGRCEPSEEEDLIGTSTILKIYLATEKEFGAFIVAVLERRLKSVCTSPLKNGFAALAFSRKEFYLWRNGIRTASQPQVLTIAAAAIELGIKQQMAYHLVHIGLLRSALGTFGKRISRQVSVDDIEQFRSTYVSATELACAWDTSPRSIVQMLRARGIDPVTGPKIDASRQYFFKKTSILNSPSSTSTSEINFL